MRDVKPSDIIGMHLAEDWVNYNKITAITLHSILCILEDIEVALLDKGHKMSSDCGPEEKDIDAADDSPGI